MEIKHIKCPNCGADLTVDADKKEVVCEYCDSRFILENEYGRWNPDDAEELGYQFEKGRQRALEEQNAYRDSENGDETGEDQIAPATSNPYHYGPSASENQSTTSSAYVYGSMTNPKYVYKKAEKTVKVRKKRRIWLWVLGWVFIFPVPATILVRRTNWNKALKLAIIIMVWLIYFGMFGQ